MLSNNPQYHQPEKVPTQQNPFREEVSPYSKLRGQQNSEKGDFIRSSVTVNSLQSKYNAYKIENRAKYYKI